MAFTWETDPGWPAAVAPAWMLPLVAFQVNWDELEQRIKPCAIPPSWDDYPAMPMVLPGGCLMLRYCLCLRERSNPFSCHLRLVLVSMRTGGVLSCQAWKVSAALTGLMSLGHLLMTDPRELEPVPIAPELMPALRMSEPEIETSLNLEHAIMDPVFRGLHEWMDVRADWPEIMRLLPAFLLDDGLWRGAQYFLGSASVFVFVGDEVGHFLRERGQCPESPYRLVDAETAVWLAFKALEAVIGDPPSREAKLRHHLDELGLLDFPGVWRHEPAIDLVEKIQDFVSTRDSRAAHGRHHSRRRPLTFFETMDFQYLTSAVLLHHARKVLAQHHHTSSSSTRFAGGSNPTKSTPK